LVNNKTTQEKHERQVSGLGRQQDGKVRCTREGTSEKTGDVFARTYSQGEWSKLTKDEREKVKELRKSWRKLRVTGNPTYIMPQPFNKRMIKMIIRLNAMSHPMRPQMERVMFLH